ncbi:MAG: gluconate 2-dehydrogenase subunit 3 family protein [Actinomycetota bacterium]|nr:gluconate 2-dehydrogenase subunit 3 family protein [Actinomycetota bacterium]
MPYRSPTRRGITPQHRGRFPGFDVLDSADAWDDVTAGVVLGRLALPGELAFFTPEEVAVAAPLLDLLLAQDADPRIPVLGLIDARLAAGETDGWHYDDMPEDAAAWRDSLRFLDQDAHTRYHERGFGQLAGDEQAGLVQAIGDMSAGGGRWHSWPATQVWSLWTRYACTAFYSHPWAWNEIGFPGPAYPRGYLNPGVDSREHWEVADQHTEDSEVDPVTFADRVEHARRDHDRVLGRGGPS